MSPETLAALTSLATFAFAAASPGPATLAVAAVAMSAGRLHGLAMAFGLAIGLAAWGILAAIGVGALVAQSAAALTVLKIIGGLYLLYLGLKSWQSSRTDETQRQLEGHSPSAARSFRRGLVLNLGNPKAVLAWVAALALGSAGSEAPALWLVALCILFGVVLYAAYALVFSVEQVMRAYRAARRWVDRVFAVLFGLAGLRLLFWSQER
ncbi:LysE family translocator [Thalassococcus sp. S3]|uniref:LysE family translocator n=1 Tax=Thalassococcus sp. S3 TaxID=2017482 RepID=UPI0010245122|nr:LysE family translocator [Thalassococcus sp. S3]QBF30011.1 hypothetical protein CFI11_02075 [Thalassococcus sp. S3]